MTSEELLRLYGRHFSQYERDEIATFDIIYYVNFNSKVKGVGTFVQGELTYQDEDPKQPNEDSNVFNHGFDNDQADYLYEAKD